MALHSHARSPGPTLIVVFGFAVVALATATPVLAQSTPGDGGGGGAGCLLGPLCQIGDPRVWLQQTITEVISRILTAVVTQYGDAIVGFVNDVNFLTRTPENLSYNHDLVKQFATATQLLASGLLAVQIVASGTIPEDAKALVDQRQWS